MPWILVGMMVGVCVGFAHWKYRAVRVQGRFFPHQGSATALIFDMMLYGGIFALVFLGFDALNGPAG